MNMARTPLAAALTFLNTLAIAQSVPLHLSDCVVSLKEEALIPAGVLVSLSVQEGSQTEAGQSIGRIDDTQQRLEHDLARAQQMETAEMARSDIDIRYAQSAADVAVAEQESASAANTRVQGAVPLSQLRRLELAADRAKLLVERSESEQRIAAHTLRGRDLAVTLAAEKVARCQVTTKISGEVIEIHKHPGEWVQPGDSIAHIVRLDTLRVEGFVSAADHDPAEIANQPVVATVALAHGQQAEFTGRIVFVRPILQGGGQFLVYAEVANRASNGHWLLRPGMVADMTIGASSEGNANSDDRRAGSASRDVQLASEMGRLSYADGE